MNNIRVGLAIAMAIWAGAGCASLRTTDSAALQGTWSGSEINGRTLGVSHLTVTGQAVEFRGADTNEWYKATFTLHEDINPRQVVALVTDCPFPQYVGKTINAIYKIEGGVLTIANKEPGNSEMPTGFDAADARHFELKKD